MRKRPKREEAPAENIPRTEEEEEEEEEEGEEEELREKNCIAKIRRKRL